jgi:hypothetical protein
MPTGAGGFPGEPWQALSDNGFGYLSYYYSEPLARWPVRQITRPGDNKSDPNIETGTYGLFSTCEPRMRNRIVKDGRATIFFVTRRPHHQPRMLTGYYHVGWFTEGAFGAVNNDYALAASAMRFFTPVSAADLPPVLADVVGAWFRTYRRLDADLTAGLKTFCDAQPDQTTKYLDEVRRIERFARARSGFAYPSWARDFGFSWADATGYYPGSTSPAKVPNSSKTNHWRCSKCGYVIRSGALLKRCPLCKTNSTLKPEEDAA